MPKTFTITGTCIPEKHYMADISAKLDAIELLVDHGSYFVINRPRQYGKTTTLFLLEQRLQNRYVPIKISFEGVGDAVFQDEQSFGDVFFGQIHDILTFIGKKYIADLIPAYTGRTMNDISRSITEFVTRVGAPVVLMIDEIDKSSNNQLFVSFLGMLRDKYLKQKEGKDATFYSVILAGVHDIKNLKLKIRADAEKKFNSPWNIAIDFSVDMRLHEGEIASMLQEYARDYGLIMDTRAMSAVFYYYTNGYPFLVSKLCKSIDETIVGTTKRSWTEHDVEHAVQMIIKEPNTLFDDLIKNLEHNEKIYHLVYDCVIRGEEVGFNIHNPSVQQGLMYGIFRDNNGKVGIDNTIFEQVIYNYMSSKTETSAHMDAYNFRENFITPEGNLDMEHVLRKFQAFMKEQRSKRDAAFLEREGRLLFLAFIKPIINGNGYDFKETQISEEKRLDVVITFNKEKYVVELKIWRGPAAHQKGLQQLADYLQRMNCSKGYLIVYDFSDTKQYTEEHVTVNGKELYIVRL